MNAKQAQCVSLSRLCLFALSFCLSAPYALAQSSPSDFTTATRYDAMRRVVGVIRPDPDGAGPLHYFAVRNSYDIAGRLIKVETGQLTSWHDESMLPANWPDFAISTTLDITVDALGRKLKEITSGGATSTATQYTYDGPGRLQCTAVRMNRAAYGSLPSSACSLGSAGGDGQDRITRNVYDNAGQLLTVQRAYGTGLQQNYASYTYTPNGKSSSITDANGNKSSMLYDGVDRLTKLSFPSKTSPGTSSSTDYEQYGYDNNGNRTSLTKRDGQVITYTIDGLDRVSFKNVPGTAGDVTYSYDVRGHQLTAQYGSGLGITTAYDGFGRPTSSSNNTDGVTRVLNYQFDADGNRTQLTFPDGNYFTYGYDGLDRMTTVVENGTTTVANISYNTMGLRSTLTGGVSTGYGYDGIGRLASLSHDLAGAAQDVTYTYNSYNAASQLLSQTRSNDSYGFNATTSSRSYVVNGLNQYTTVGTVTPTYDANGNLQSDGINTYTYDVENRLISGSGPTSTTLSYDPAGRLNQTISTSTTVFLYDGDELVAEYNSAGTLLRRYVHGPGSDDPILWYEGAGLTTRRYLRTDHEGSVVAVTDSSGNSVAINTYDEYGIRSVNNQGRFQYTGQILIPELSLYYYKARMYSSSWGRFLQTDPIGYADDNNLYAYVGNDPVDRKDPTGLASDSGCSTGTLLGSSVICSGVSGSQSGAPNPYVSATKKGEPQGQQSETEDAAVIPSPNGVVPGGPWTPAGPGQLPGTFYGPKQPTGPRPMTTWVPPEGEGGQPGSKGYWKKILPNGEWQRYDRQGIPRSPEEVHPGTRPPSGPILFPRSFAPLFHD